MKKTIFLLLLLIVAVGSLFAQVIINYGFEDATYPPTGWTHTIVSGGTGIQRAATMSYPTLTPRTGGWMGYYNAFSLSSGSNAWLATPTVSCTGGANRMYTVSFWMYRDPGYVGYDEGYRIYSNTSASLTGATLLGTVHRGIDMSPIVPAAGWYQYTFTIGDGTVGDKNIIFNAYSAYGNNIAIDDITIEWVDLTQPPNPAQIVSPLDGATNVLTSASLNWLGGSGFPTSYDVYFGTTLPGTPNANVAGTTWTPPPMDGFTVYQWMIVPRNANGPATGCPTWSFTTAAPALSGIKTIDPAGSGANNYTTFTAAISALNGSGVSSTGVTFNVATGVTFAEAAVLPAITVTGTSTGPIIFQKVDAGTNPLVTVPGTTGTTDYVFKVTGGDYITFDGINVANATGTTAIEYGFWFLGTTGNGCSYNVVQNCTITLDRINTSTKGIYTSTVSGAPNNWNSFASNIVNNSYYGIQLVGISGSTDNNNQVQWNTVNNTALYNIDVRYQTTGWVHHNIINYPAAALTSSLYGLYLYYCPSLLVYNNTINGGAGGTSGTYYNIYPYYCGSADIYNNTINGIRSTGTSTMYGYYPYYCTGNMNFYNNTISNVTSTSTATVYGMYPYYGAATHSIYGNSIYGFDTKGTTYGIYGYASSTSTANIYGNNVYNLYYSGTGTHIITGIGLGLGSVNNVYNNMVYDIKAPAGTAAATAPQVRGFGIIGGTTNNIWNNSVYLNATGSAAAFSSAAIYYSSGTTNDQKNNIFINNGTPGASGKNVAFWKSTTLFANFTATMDKNIYHAGVQDATHLVFFNGTNSCQTVDEYKTLNVGKDQGCYYEDSRFISVASPYNLHINPALVTRIEGNALPIAMVATDIDNEARTGMPDIGADEGAFQAPAGAPNPVTNLAPANSAIGVNPTTFSFSWTPAATGGTPTNYMVFVSDAMETLFDDGFEVLAPATSWMPNSGASPRLLAFNTIYYWMVYPGNGDGSPNVEDCAVWTFRTGYQMTAPTTLAIGNAWPGSPKTGTIAVQNWGSTPIDLTAAGTDFSFGTGLTIPANSILNLPYTFNVPMTEGPYTGQFTLTDTAPGGAVIDVAVTANITTSLIIGDGVSNLYLPVNPFYGYSYSQTIYYPSEISYPAGYRIEKVYYYCNGFETAEVTQNFVMYMGHTTNSTFATTTSWEPLANLTQVYNQINTPQLTAGGYWMEFILSTPFVYNGVDNLVIGVEEDLASYDTSSSYFYCTNTPGVNRSLYNYSDSVNPEPAAPPAGTLTAGFPNTKFYVGALPSNPVFSVTPASQNFGQLLTTSAPVTQTFTIQNTGAGSLPVNAIGYTGDAAFTLVNMPALPFSLTAGQSQQFGVQFNPATAGTFTGTVTVTDGLRVEHTIAISGSSIDVSGGYHVANSFQTTLPSYPTYNWIDISTTGTEIVGLTDIDYTLTPIPLGITFPFFGNSYTEAYVTSNGYMTFGSGSCTDGNPGIPNAALPNNFISFFWDDMLCSSTTVTDDWIKYANVDGNFVITFHKLPEYGGLDTGWITGQVILYPSGKIKMQYAAKGSTLDQTSYTTGIEGATGIAGVQYHYDATGLSVFGPAGEPQAVAFGTGDLSDPVMTLDAPVVTATEVATGIQLAWTAIAGANSYNIYSSATPHGPWTLAAGGLSVTSVTIAYADLAALAFVQVTASSTPPTPAPQGRTTITAPAIGSSNIIKINKAVKK